MVLLFKLTYIVQKKDIEDLNAYKPNLRLVKGAYKEPEEVAFPDKKDVDDNYKKIIKMHLLNGNYTAIASHDEAIIEYTKNLLKNIIFQGINLNSKCYMVFVMSVNLS